jgi:hypothetical protein
MFHADPRLRAMIEQLFRSENGHIITCADPDGNYSRPLNYDYDDAANGVGVGSTIGYDPDNWFGLDGQLRDPAISLTHELRHSQQYDVGVAMFSENPNSHIIRTEEWAVRRENIMRDALGYSRRTTYGGFPVQNPGPR